MLFSDVSTLDFKKYSSHFPLQKLLSKSIPAIRMKKAYSMVLELFQFNRVMSVLEESAISLNLKLLEANYLLQKI